MKRWLPLAMLALAPLAAPLLAASHPLIALVIRSFFSRLCHQNPARSFVVQGSPVAVCVRCLGIYCGVALGALFRSAKMPAAAAGSRAAAQSARCRRRNAHWHGNLPLTTILAGTVLLAVALRAASFSTGVDSAGYLLRTWYRNLNASAH